MSITRKDQSIFLLRMIPSITKLSFGSRIHHLPGVATPKITNTQIAMQRVHSFKVINLETIGSSLLDSFSSTRRDARCSFRPIFC